MSPTKFRIREHLSRSDLEFVLSVLGSNDSERNAILRLLGDPHTVLTILEQDDLVRVVLEGRDHLPITARFYFYLLVRRALKDVGLADPDLAEYVAAVLADYARLARKGGAVPEILYSVDLIHQLRNASAYERFFIYSAAGDRFLFLTGIFPRFLERRERRWGAPGVGYYGQVAAQSFRAARDHPLAREFDLEHVYDTLADEFEATRRVLNDFSDNLVSLN